jgi:hypothetical protein
MKAIRRSSWLPATVALACAAALPLQAHHSFAPYDMQKTKVITGVVTRVSPDANHLQIFFAEMNAERKNVLRDAANKPIIWSVEMAGSAMSAQDGISVAAFPEGSVFSVAVHPARSGDPSGFREGPLFKCPVGATGKSIPPKAGLHCDSVEGSKSHGQGRLPTPTN